jgi:hypothetical protein
MTLGDSTPEKADSVASKYENEKFSRNPHITMAHWKEKSQEQIRLAFEPIGDSFSSQRHSNCISVEYASRRYRCHGS